MTVTERTGHLYFVLSNTSRTVHLRPGLRIHDIRPCLAQNLRLNYQPQVFSTKLLIVLRLTKIFKLQYKIHSQLPLPQNHLQSLKKFQQHLSIVTAKVLQLVPASSLPNQVRSKPPPLSPAPHTRIMSAPTARVPEKHNSHRQSA